MLPVANGNPPHLRCIHPSLLQILLAQPYTSTLQSLLGNGEALASTDARSNHAVLYFSGTFFIKKKGAKDNYM